jgi:dimethylaniline monooxygenase (N-oxide forming)
VSKTVCVVGAGSSGLAAIRELRLDGHEVACFESGTAIGGSWRYGNDNGVSATYASLHANVSRRHLHYPSLRFPGPIEERPHHTQLLAYLETYAEVNDLLGSISLGTRVNRARADDRGGWIVEAGGLPARRFDALVVAAGQFWDPQIPELAGEFSGETMHTRDYRTPETFEGRRVLVVGAGQSALDIAAEISFVAERTLLSCRQGHHLIPARILGRAADRLDSPTLNRLPWPVVRRSFEALLRLTGAKPDPGDLPVPDFPMMEYRWPVVVTPNIERSLAERTFTVRPGITRLEGEQVAFADGTREEVDAIVFATGYRVNSRSCPARSVAARGNGSPFTGASSRPVPTISPSSASSTPARAASKWSSVRLNGCRRRSPVAWIFPLAPRCGPRSMLETSPGPIAASVAAAHTPPCATAMHICALSMGT